MKKLAALLLLLASASYGAGPTNTTTRPSGDAGRVQVSGGGVFDSSGTFTFNKTTNVLSVSTVSVSSFSVTGATETHNGVTYIMPPVVNVGTSTDLRIPVWDPVTKHVEMYEAIDDGAILSDTQTFTGGNTFLNDTFFVRSASGDSAIESDIDSGLVTVGGPAFGVKLNGSVFLGDDVSWVSGNGKNADGFASIGSNSLYVPGAGDVPGPSGIYRYPLDNTAYLVLNFQDEGSNEYTVGWMAPKPFTNNAGDNAHWIRMPAREPHVNDVLAIKAVDADYSNIYIATWTAQTESGAESPFENATSSGSISMGGNDIQHVGSVGYSDGAQSFTASFQNGVATGTVTSAGQMRATQFIGDGSNLTDLPLTPPAGSNFGVQYKNGSVFASDTQFTYTGSGNNVSMGAGGLTFTADLFNNWVGIGTNSPIRRLDVRGPDDLVNFEMTSAGSTYSDPYDGNLSVGNFAPIISTYWNKDFGPGAQNDAQFLATGEMNRTDGVRDESGEISVVWVDATQAGLSSRMQFELRKGGQSYQNRGVMAALNPLGTLGSYWRVGPGDTLTSTSSWHGGAYLASIRQNMAIVSAGAEPTATAGSYVQRSTPTVVMEAGVDEGTWKVCIDTYTAQGSTFNPPDYNCIRFSSAGFAAVTISKTKVELKDESPAAAGISYYCTDCSVDATVVSTGTARGSFGQTGNRVAAPN